MTELELRVAALEEQLRLTTEVAAACKYLLLTLLESGSLGRDLQEKYLRADARAKEAARD